jgi:farnesyl-diphosphate farnesyltransferase
VNFSTSPRQASGFETDSNRSLLRDVSRSFYISLRLLPPGMRPACGLGYLLARLCDTVADASRAPLSRRRAWLLELREALLHEGALPDLSPLLSCLDHPGERTLTERARDCLLALRASDGPEREPLREVLDSITRGQLLDLDFFANAAPGQPHHLPSEDALILYADAVAGCVGRFWTRIAWQSNPSFATEPLDRMMAWGTRFGQALQWINIVRDRHEDLPNGRGYLPDGEAPAIWLDRAEAGLRDGIRYTAALRGRRLRLATALPALLGAATIRELRAHADTFDTQRIKISRTETSAIVRGAAWRILCQRPLAAYFETLLQPKRTNSGGTGASKSRGTPVTG